MIQLVSGALVDEAGSGAIMTTKASDLLCMIRARYQGPEWAVLDEIHDGTGRSSTRRFDAVAFNCWPSHNFIRLGFEIKISRADFSKELAAHEKRAALEKHCHEVYFVVGPDVCAAREIPEPWGLLEVRGNKLHCTRKASHRNVDTMAEKFAVCAIRRLTEAADAERQRHYRFEGAEVTQADIDARVTEAVKAEREYIEREQLRVGKAKAELSQAQETFQRNAGAWWNVWRALERAAEGYGTSYGAASMCEPPTLVQLAATIDRIRLRSSSDLEQRLRSVHASIGAAIEAMTPTPEAKDSPSGPIMADGEIST